MLHALTFLMMFLSAFQGCMKQDFNSSNTSSNKSNDVFNVGSGSPVHMLWIVDNSPSMEDDVAAVKKGIASFVEGLQASTVHVEMTMITSTQDGSSKIPADLLEDAGVHVIPAFVGSQDQTHMLAEYLDPALAESLGFSGAETGFEVPFNLSHHPSADFFRNPDALKVFVVVTDNIEKSVGTRVAGDVFVELLESLYDDLSSFRWFSFIDLSRKNPSYERLTERLGGKTWNIVGSSPEKWQEALHAAQRRVLSATRGKAFTLKRPAQEIHEVRLGGVVLTSEDYDIQNGAIRIIGRELQEGDVLEVIYK